MSTCACGLPTDPPAHLLWWRSDVHADPGPPVCSVVRWGEDPDQRRAVRLTNGTGWAERGVDVVFSEAITLPMSWERVGRCPADTTHPVVAVRERPGGGWTY